MLPRGVSFSGGGHLLVYHLGVILRLRAAGLGNADGIRCHAGSTGGAIAACAAACISLPAADTEIAQLTADQTPKSPMPGHRGLFSRSRQNRDSRDSGQIGIPAKSGFPISRNPGFRPNRDSNPGKSKRLIVQ